MCGLGYFECFDRKAFLKCRLHPPVTVEGDQEGNREGEGHGGGNEPDKLREKKGQFGPPAFVFEAA